MRDIIACINSQCGATAGDCGCAAKVREVAAFLERLTITLDSFTRWDDDDEQLIETTAAECRAWAKQLKGEA